jgi:cold shock CspA family protein
VHWYSKNLGHGLIVPEDGGSQAFVRREDLAAGEEENLKNMTKCSSRRSRARRNRRPGTYRELDRLDDGFALFARCLEVAFLGIARNIAVLVKPSLSIP